MTARRVYLVRHGATAGDAALRFVGSTDLPLGRDGEQQALRLRAALRRAAIGAAWCSDLERSRRTAEIILDGRGIPLHECQGLREVAMGAWEGRLRSEVATAFPAEFHARGEDLEHYRVPGGESLGDCRGRVLAAWTGIVGFSSADALIVGHAGVNRLLLCHLLGMPPANLFRLGQDPGCLNIIQSAAGGWRVALLNWPDAT
jgi:probable phosphoglycerate mutase